MRKPKLETLQNRSINYKSDQRERKRRKIHIRSFRSDLFRKSQNRNKLQYQIIKRSVVVHCQKCNKLAAIINSQARIKKP